MDKNSAVKDRKFGIVSKGYDTAGRLMLRRLEDHAGIICLKKFEKSSWLLLFRHSFLLPTSCKADYGGKKSRSQKR